MQYVASVTASSKVALLLENYTPDVDHLHLACYPLLSIPRDLDIDAQSLLHFWQQGRYLTKEKSDRIAPT